MPFETESARALAAMEWKFLSHDIHRAINLLNGAKTNIQSFREKLNTSEVFSDTDKALVDGKIQSLRDDVLAILGVSS